MYEQKSSSLKVHPNREFTSRSIGREGLIQEHNTCCNLQLHCSIKYSLVLQIFLSEYPEAAFITGRSCFSMT